MPRLIGFVPGGWKTSRPACSPGFSSVYVFSSSAGGADGAGGAAAGGGFGFSTGA
jgi:hypothetical protein